MSLRAVAPLLQVSLIGIGKLSFLLTAVLLYKALSVSDVGLFSLLYAVAIILATVAECGLRGLLVREVARSRDSAEDKNHIFSAAIKARLITIVPYFCLGILAAWLVSPEHSLPILLLLLTAAWLDSNSNIFRGVLRAHNLILTDAAVAGLTRVGLLALTGVLYWTEGLTLFRFALSFAFVTVIESAVTFALIHWKTRTSAQPAVNLTQTIALVKRGLPFIIVNILGIMYLKVAVILLGIIPDDFSLEQVAAFNVSGRIPEGVAFLPIALVNALIPYFARNAADESLITPVFQKLERVLGCAGIMISIGIVAFAEPLILLIATEEYLQYKLSFQLYGTTLFFSFLQYVYANLLIAKDHENWVAKRYGLMLLLNVILSSIFIWFAGLTGAVVALLMCEIAAVLIDYKLLKNLGFHPGSQNLLFWISLVAGSLVFSTALLLIMPDGRAMYVYFVVALVFGATLLLRAQISHYNAPN